ncbi:MAG: L,D-transpeptidase family protein [Lachnospiraceae bacterium]|nr:L,D-transpeptidase family protein [Lachnospiraceae bacterium]
MKKKSVRKIVTIVLVVFMLLLILGAAGVYLYYGYVHKDEFFKSITINGISCGGLTVDEVEDKIREGAENYSLTVTPKDGEPEIITTDMINYHYVSDGSVQNYFNQQKWYEWIKGYLNGYDESYQVAVKLEYDQEALKTAMNSLAFMQPDYQSPPVNSEMVYQDGQYVVTAAVDGNQVNSDILYEALKKAVDEAGTAVSVQDIGAYVMPTVTQGDTLLNANCNVLNTQTNMTITIDLPNDTKMTLTKDDFLSWMSIDEAGQYYRDDAVFNERIAAFVAQMKDAVSAANSSSYTFTGANGGTHTLSTKLNLGWALSTDEETAQLTQDIYAGASLEREPKYSRRRIAENGGIGNTFAEVDLSGQHMWYVEDGVVKMESDIVSGTLNIATSKTPPGIFKLYNKEKDRTLKGTMQADGTYEYQSKVKFWMPFNGGIGFHDASWRESGGSFFGGTYYIDGGSHGCINMPTDRAGQLYDLISTGCIVVCYYTS